MGSRLVVVLFIAPVVPQVQDDSAMQQRGHGERGCPRTHAMHAGQFAQHRQREITRLGCAPRAASWRTARQEPRLKASLGRCRRRAVVALACALAWPLAGAQGYPNRPIRLLVGYAAGGGVDATARMLAQRLPAVLGSRWWWKTGPVHPG
jgi:hypothetical protein